MRDDLDQRRPPQRVPTTRLNAEAAAQVATTLQPLATPSRLLILTELRQAPAR